MQRAPTPSKVRFPVNPGDVPPEKAARRLHLTPAEFRAKLAELLARGFPPADTTTGMFDLDAIDAWRASRHRNPQAHGVAPAGPGAEGRPNVDDMVERFCAAKERRRHG